MKRSPFLTQEMFMKSFYSYNKKHHYGNNCEHTKIAIRKLDSKNVRLNAYVKHFLSNICSCCRKYSLHLPQICGVIENMKD